MDFSTDSSSSSFTSNKDEIIGTTDIILNDIDGESDFTSQTSLVENTTNKNNVLWILDIAKKIKDVSILLLIFIKFV